METLSRAETGPRTFTASTGGGPGGLGAAGSWRKDVSGVLFGDRRPATGDRRPATGAPA
ncbi:hypothetical protein [Streptomyces sp. NPDC102283]|uniref:hypothetical protein n=1 Tax=Streptomyces sp. NPDC102283 TaxID=3366155 RepID=UPI0037FB32A6